MEFGWNSWRKMLHYEVAWSIGQWTCQLVYSVPRVRAKLETRDIYFFVPETEGSADFMEDNDEVNAYQAYRSLCGGGAGGTDISTFNFVFWSREVGEIRSHRNGGGLSVLRRNIHSSNVSSHDETKKP